MIARTRAATLVALLGVCVGCAGGCYVRDRTIRIIGRPLEASVLARVEENVTTRQDLIDQFGPPHEVRKQPDGTQVAIYRYVKSVHESKSYGILGGSQRQATHAATYEFTLRDGIVVDAAVRSTAKQPE